MIKFLLNDNRDMIFFYIMYALYNNSYIWTCDKCIEINISKTTEYDQRHGKNIILNFIILTFENIKKIQSSPPPMKFCSLRAFPQSNISYFTPFNVGIM